MHYVDVWAEKQGRHWRQHSIRCSRPNCGDYWERWNAGLKETLLPSQAGDGSWEPLIRERAERCSNIHFHPAVSPQELGKYTVCADVGLCLIEDCCLSYRYCLPNKLFEYLAAGLPTIISNLPDMARVIEKFQCGWIVEPNSDSVAAVVNGITPEILAEKAKAARSHRQDFSWEEEERTLIEVYAKDFPTTSVNARQAS